MKKYTKRQIEKKIFESKGYKVYSKNDLKLKEDTNNTSVYTSGDGTSSSASVAARTAFQKSPTASTATIDSTTIDNNSTTVKPTIQSPSSNQKDINMTIKSMKPGTKYNLQIPNDKLQTSGVKRLKDLVESSVPFTKKEIKNMLKK